MMSAGLGAAFERAFRVHLRKERLRRIVKRGSPDHWLAAFWRADRVWRARVERFERMTWGAS